MDRQLNQRWSNFHITVNLNIPNNDATRTAAALTLTPAFREISRRNTLWQWLRYFNGQEQVAFAAGRNLGPNARRSIQRLRFRIALEAGGEENASLHAHIILEIMHRSRVQINGAALRQAFVAVLPDYMHGLNINCRFVRGDPQTEDREYLLRYLLKDGVPVEEPNNPANADLHNAYWGEFDPVQVTIRQPNVNEGQLDEIMGRGAPHPVFRGFV